MTTPARAAEPVPQYWTDREPGEPAARWVARMQLLYRITRPGALARLARASAADVRPRSPRQPGHPRPGVNDLGGQDPYPWFGADQNDIDTEAPGE
jgi:hypothetical protein